MKNVRVFAAICATMFAVSVGFAGGEECQKDAAKGEKGACCAEGKKMADKGACADMGKDAADCAAKCAAEAKGGAEDAAKGEGFGIGQKPPAIELTDAVSGAAAPVVDDKAAATVVIFWNQSCPFVMEAQDRVATFAKEMTSKNVRVVAIDANDPGKANSPEKIKEYASTRPFPVLMNPDSSVAARFGASRTPEAFVLDGKGVVQYHGAFDGGAKDPSKTFVADAVTAVLDGKTPAVTESKAFGCTIKFSDSVAKDAAKSAVKEIKTDAKAKMGEARAARKEAHVNMKAKGEKKAEAAAEAAVAAEAAPKN